MKTMPMRFLIYSIILFLGSTAPVANCADADFDPKSTRQLSVIRPQSFSEAERLALVTLQGLANRDSAQIWLESSGMNRHILDDLQREGWTLSREVDFWNLLERYRSVFEGAVICELGKESVNEATSWCGIRNLIALDRSLEEQWVLKGWPVLMDLTQSNPSDAKASIPWQEFNSSWVVHQAPGKSWHLRDFAVASQAFTFSEENSRRRVGTLKRLGDAPVVLGWGADERSLVQDASKAGGAVIAADWSLNLSALQHLQVELTNPPLSPPVEVHRGERVIAFVISDGDNIQWVGGSFIDRTGFWASPRRGEFPVVWEMAPVLAKLAPRALDHFYRSAAAAKDEFIAGPSGHAYYFPSRSPNPEFHAAKTAQDLSAARLRISTILNNGGSMRDAEEVLKHPEVDAIFYKDWAPYNKRQGAIEWFVGKPCIAYKYLLWEPKHENSPAGIAEALSRLPSDPINNPDSFALINVHAWSWKDIGGPMEAIHQTIQLAPPGTRVVTASQFVQLLKATQ